MSPADTELLSTQYKSLSPNKKTPTALPAKQHFISTDSGTETDTRAARLRLKAKDRRSSRSDLDEIVKENTRRNARSSTRNRSKSRERNKSRERSQSRGRTRDRRNKL